MEGLIFKLISTLVSISLIGLHGALADHILADGNNKCRDGWVALHRGCYKFVSSRRQYLPHEKAIGECKRMDADLIVIQSATEKGDIEAHLNAKYKKSKWWVSLSQQKDKKWRWGDNTDHAENLLPWKNIRYRDKPKGPCAVIDLNKRSLAVANDPCTRRKGYICEYHEINPRASTLSVIDEETSGKSTQVQSTYPSSTVGTKEKSNVSTVTTSVTSPMKSDSTDSTTMKVKPQQNNTTSKTGNATQQTFSTEFVTTPKSAVTNSIKNNKDETTAQTARFQQSTVVTKNTQPTKSLGVSKVSPRVTRSTTRGVSFPSVATSTSDDFGTDDEEEEDSVTESQRETSDHFTKFTPFTGLSNGPTTRLTSPVFVPSTTTTADVTDATDDEDSDDGLTMEDVLQGTDGDRADPKVPLNKKGGHRHTSPRPNTNRPTTPKRRLNPQKSFRYWLEAMEDYEGCYIPGMRGTVRQMVMTARNLYQDGADYCPPVTASRLTFPRTAAGETAIVECRKGTGSATLHCGDDTVCWEDQPDLSGCASPKFKALLNKIKEEQIETMVSPSPEKETAVVEQSFNMTSQLVAMTEDDDMSMEDILVTSEVLTAFTHTTEDRKVKVKDRKAVKKIVGNVVKVGSNLLSKKKKKLWRKMRTGDKIRSASSLMVAMETTTLSMADNIEEPTVIKQVEENMEVEIQVVDVEKMEEEDEDEIVYDSEQSENTFSIPLENLRGTTHGKLDKIVFITHYSMAEFLDGGDDDDDDEDDEDDEDDVSEASNQGKSGDGTGDEDNATGKIDETVVKTGETKPEEEQEEEDPAPQIGSYIMSASIGGGEGHKVKLQKPVTFTMKHTLVVRKEDTRLCSFWDVSQGGSQGFWSQEGCRVKKSNHSHTTCECDHMTSFAILFDVHAYGNETPDIHKAVLRLITIVGCVISCLCLIVSWLTFQFCTALQGERNSIHKNLTACLFVSELLFVAGVTHTEPEIACSIVAVFLHFFFLCAFTWMFLEGLHIVFMLVQVFDPTKSRLPHYYATGYGLPAVVVTISCIVYFPGYGTEEFCWLTTDQYFIWSFAGPVALILLVNAIFLTYAMTTVCRHSDYVFNAKDRSAGSSISSWIRGALALEVLLGLTWTLGYFLLNDNTLPLAYAFTILNSLQGMFIFIFHCALNKKAQKEYFKILRVPLGISSIFASTQSTTGKRTHGSTKIHEMTHSSSNSRKASLHYKPSNASQHNNYFNDKHQKENDALHMNGDNNKVFCNNNVNIQTSKDLDVENGKEIITIDSGGRKV